MPKYRICCAALVSSTYEAYLKNLAVYTRALAPIRVDSALLKVWVTEDITLYNYWSKRISV